MILPPPSEKLEVPRATMSASPTPSLRSISSLVHSSLYHDLSTSSDRSLSPPAYHEQARKPLSPVTYTFWPQAEIPNSMILAPPIDISDAGPSYFISVKMNLFTPTSYITTIQRNSQDGDFVGHFEMGLTTSKRPSMICFKGNDYLLSEVMKSGHQPFRSSWTWKIPDPSCNTVFLHWDDSAAQNVLTCFSSKDKTLNTVLARFIPPYHPRKHNQPVQMHRLEISPQGHECFEDILMSALIVERLRTTP